MPRGDRTGPMGMGPMTGRGAGFCNGFTTSGSEQRGRGMGGFGRGCGNGRMLGNLFCRVGYSALTSHMPGPRKIRLKKNQIWSARQNGLNRSIRGFRNR